MLSPYEATAYGHGKDAIGGSKVLLELIICRHIAQPFQLA